MKYCVVFIGSLILGCGSPIVNHQRAQNTSSSSLKGVDGTTRFGDSRSDLKRPECELEFSKLVEPLCASMTFNAQPRIAIDSPFMLRFWERAKDREEERTFVVPKDQLRVYLWMPMGHGSKPVKIERTSKNVFEIRNVFFSMAGKWEIHLQFRSGEEVIEDRIWEVTL